MVKLFVVSDVHSYFTIMHNELKKNGFEENNPEHLLIVCGDVFDRGSESAEMFEYLNNLTNVVLIRGNHEDLLEEVWHRNYCMSYDQSNGTLRTINDIFYSHYDVEPYEPIRVSEKILKPFLDKMVNYFETKNYIFVHSFIALTNKDGLPMYYTRNRQFEFNPDWRNAHASEWEEARWGNPFDLASKGFLPDKTLVFGHFHTSYARNKFDGKPEFGDGADFSIYYGDGFIGIDGCTAHTGKVNVLVLEDEFI